MILHLIYHLTAILWYSLPIAPTVRATKRKTFGCRKNQVKGGYGRSDIYGSQADSNDSLVVTNIGTMINTTSSEADVYIDPLERFLLFASTNRNDSFGADDIYVSFREGISWSKPLNLGPKVNSYAYEYGAWVDEASGFLYFNSYRRGSSDIYRVALSDIDVLKEIVDWQ